MPTEPQIEILSLKRRNRIFIFLLLVFLIALPAMIFYTTGYRLNFDNRETSIVTTGGMYITTDNLGVEVYIDEEQISKPRLFRSAYYIQNVEAGKHRVVVQGENLQTWVKELFVDSHIVVESSAFNMPSIPRVRPITEYETTNRLPVFTETSTTTNLFPKATTTIPFYATSTNSTSTYSINEEYIFVQSLFGTTSVKKSVFEKEDDSLDRFRFSTTSNLVSTTTELENIIQRRNISLVIRENDIYAVWLGGRNRIPYYFCVAKDTSSSTAIRYGEHVADSVDELAMSTTTPLILDGNRVCRPEIKLDRLRQDVYFYDFFPNSSDLVLLLLEDGLYVTEIDDRGWQNSQLLYPGHDLTVVLENNTVYLNEEGKYFEVITQIEPI